MKKIIACTLATVVFNIFSPVVPLAHAGIIENQLTQVIAKDDNIARIQQLLVVKKQLEEGNKQGILEALAKTAMEQSTQSKDAKKKVQDAILEQVGKSIADQAGPYEKEIAIITALLTNQSLTPKTTLENNSLSGAPQNYKRILNMTATAYAPGPLDNGKWGNLTYVGGIVKHGVVAVDPRVIPMGTKLWVEGYGEAIAEDQGSAIKGNRIDLAFDDRQQALDYGIQNVKIYVLN